MNYLGSTDPHLVACFKFNECGGTLLTDIKSGYDGVLIGMEGDEWLESDACPVYNVNFIVTDDPGAIPVVGATVNMSGTIRYTDDSGQADFVGYETGSYEYSVTKDGYAVATGTFDLVNEDVTIEVSLLISAMSNSTRKEVRIYPNPVSGILNIQTPSAFEMEILDISGRVILNESLTRGTNRIDLSDQKPGLYYLKLKHDQQIRIEKLMIR